MLGNVLQVTKTTSDSRRKDTGGSQKSKERLIKQATKRGSKFQEHIVGLFRTPTRPFFVATMAQFIFSSYSNTMDRA